MYLELSAGSIEYEDTGIGAPIVLLHGVFMNASLWDAVTDQLRDEYRCIRPALPLGGHTTPMPEADVTPHGVARMVDELLERLDLSDVTLVGVDTGGAIAQLLMADGCRRVGRLVLAACDAYDNFPPGLPGKTSALSARLPGGLLMAGWAMRVPAFTRLPLTWGWMAKRPIAGHRLDNWFAPLRSQAGVRRDARRFLRNLDARELSIASGAMSTVDVPSLVLWPTEDKVMPPEHARRLAQALPNARLEWVDDSYTLLPLDRPEEFAARLREFAAS